MVSCVFDKYNIAAWHLLVGTRLVCGPGGPNVATWIRAIRGKTEGKKQKRHHLEGAREKYPRNGCDVAERGIYPRYLRVDDNIPRPASAFEL